MQRTYPEALKLLRAAAALLCLMLPVLPAHSTSNGAAAFTPVASGSSTNTAATFASSPIVSIQSATPFGLIAMSRDQSLDKKAYDDYTDLNADGVPDVGYQGTIAYFGYFDPLVCYTYNGTYFVPKEFTDSNYHCNLNGTTNEWSGNFLDWASMTRMDELRKILFGGERSTDGTGASAVTILRRQFLPSDGHSFVKYYNGTDVNQLMPFNLANGKYGTTDGSSSAGHCSDSTGQKCGVTLCNTTAAPMGGSSDLFSEKVNQTTYPPLIRAAFGNYSLWASNERWQCRWGEELQTLSSGNNAGGNGNAGSNGNASASSGIYAYAYSPFQSGTTSGHTPASAPAAKLISSTDSYGPDFGALVQVCVANLTTSSENCKQYPTGDSKPIGLLQLYGDDNEMNFGMIAGSYSSNKEGGTLVKNVGTLNDEVDAAGDGHFKEYYITGTCTSSACAGIINAISLYTLAGYDYKDGTYNNTDGSLSGCSWGLNTFSNGNCANWGNPFAEIYLNSIRYLAGLGVSGAFQANDSGTITALNTDTTSQWADPLSSSTRCTSLNVIALNSSSISYDANDLNGSAPATPGVKEIWSGSDIATMTNAVGTGEGLAGQYFFGGTWNYSTNAFSGDGLCTAKTFSSLSAVNGICPDAPRLQGSYDIAGIAYWAHTHDIRATGGNALTGNQLVTTYSVALATGTPIMTIPVPSSSKTITIIPACQNTTVGGNCALVDFKIVAQDRVNGTGTFYFNWEDSEQGGDFDEDAWGVLSYTIASGKITVKTTSVAVSTPYAMGLGFVIAGTTQDGFHVFSGVNSYSNTDSYSGVPHCSSCNAGDAAVSYGFTIGSSTAQSLQDPLWYAAKYGAFQDQNANSLPDLPGEWDCYNTDGNKNTNCGGSETPDGVPDTYYKANNPSALYAALQRAFQAILAKTASGTAAAVVANARQGNGAVYQALYEPLHQDIHGNAANWLGTLYSLFVDQFGNLREDGNHDRKMGDYTTDPIVSIFFDPVNNVTEFRRYIACDPTVVQVSTCSSIVLPLDQLNTVWNARDQLASMTPTQVAKQRAYATDLANTGRYILTWLGARDSSGNPTTVDFLPATFTSTNLGYLNPDLTGTPTPTAATELTQAQSIVSWVRGVEQTGMRSRTVDYFNNGTLLVERLGDIVNSTPTVVAQPQEAFDILYSDKTFLTFRTHWLNRRTVVFVGANDGMLHAFNGGFFNPTTTTFDLTATQADGSTPLSHPLGTELWAYAPMDLLPHLKWLTQSSYPHVYYMDAKSRVFDAKIFTADTDHPGGWGTVLIIGMRFGGGSICINTAASSLSTCSATASSAINTPASLPATVTLQSAYTMLDITNPEKPPVLMDEFFVPSNLSTGTPASVSAFTTSYPTVVTFRKTDETVNKWYLVFGSGPTDLQNAISNQDAQFFVYDLSQYKTGTIGTKIIKDYDLSTTAQGFTGDPVSADWDLNFYDNATYFGTCGNTAASPTGSIYRFGVDETPTSSSWLAPQVLLALPSGQCELPTPSVVLDPNKNPWLYFGTGRFFVNADKSTSSQQAFYGIKDRNSSVTASVGTTPITADASTKIVNVSSAQLTTLGVLSGVSTYLGGGSLGSSPNKVTTLQTLMLTTTPDGWGLNFPASTVVTTVSPVPTTRNVSETAVIGGIFFGTAYSPDPDLCAAEGLSNLYGVYYLTGTPIATAQVFGQDSTHTYVVSNVALGAGLASSPSLQVAKGLGNSQAEIYTQTSTGAIVQTGATLASNTTSGEISWQQPNQ